MSTPDFTQKLAGLLVPVFALREEGSLGIGDTHSMRYAIDFCASHGFGVLQILPINETGGDHSPYNAISSVSLDPALLHVGKDSVPGLTLIDIEDLVPDSLYRDLSIGPVQYPVVKKLKLQLLRRAFERFKLTDSGQLGAFQAFQKEHSRWLINYTLFRTLLDEHHGDARWPLWAPEWRNPSSAEAQLSRHPQAERLLDTRQFYAFVQWVAFSQWIEVKAYATTKRVKLMGDIPFGVSRYGADVWGEQSLFDLAWSGGAPPETHFKSDPFTEKWGQNWGIPLYDWSAMQRDHYSWWRQRVARTCEVFHSFRIDHVLGFFRVYSFPWTPERNNDFVDLDPKAAMTRCGGRVPGFIPRPDEPQELGELNAQDGEHLLRIVQEASGESIVVAEDLGMVPDYVRPLLSEMNIPGFTIPLFERCKKDKSYALAQNYPAINLATYATHDHPPIAEFYDHLVKWWTGPNGHEGWLEVCRLMEFLGTTGESAPREFTQELHLKFIETLLKTPCWLAVFMITDLLGTHQRFNSPGSVGASNWSERLEYPLDYYSETEPFSTIIRKTSEHIESQDRLP